MSIVWSHERVGRDPCAYCGAASDVLDHVTPRSAGGGDEWENLAPACSSCNSAKGARTLLGFLGSRRLKSDPDTIRLRAAVDAHAAQRAGWHRVGRAPA